MTDTIKPGVGKTYLTRDGRKVQCFCTDRRDDIYPVLCFVDDGVTEAVATYTVDGHFHYDRTVDAYDLVAEALTAAGYGGFEVVPLVWEECGKDDPFLYIARTLSGDYNIGRGNAAGEYFAVHDGAFMEWWPGESEDGQNTEQAAKAVCEADHRERVSKLVRGVDVSELVEAVRKAIETWKTNDLPYERRVQVMRDLENALLPAPEVK
jgi:hypothetical protein